MDMDKHRSSFLAALAVYALLYTAFLCLFEFIYKIIKLICINIWIIQNSVVYLYYQRNTNKLLINKLNSTYYDKARIFKLTNNKKNNEHFTGTVF